LVESAADYIVELFRDKMPEELIIFIISLLPILELRGGMIAAKLLGVKLAKAFIICYIGNIIPIPFILLFIRRIFAAMRKTKRLGKIADKIEEKSLKKKDKVLKYKQWGLLLFVAIPLPGTGGWTGALLAALLDIRLKTSLPLIALGVLIADVIMMALSYGLLGMIL